MFAVAEDMDVVVAEIVIVVVEVVPATVVDTSAVEDVAVIDVLLTHLILKLKDMALLDIRLLNLLQVVVVDRVVVRFNLPVVTIALLVLIGNGKAVGLTVCIKAAVDLPLVPLIVRTSAISAKVAPIKNAKNNAMQKEKKSVATNSRNITGRKDKQKEKNSVTWKLANKKQNKRLTPISLMNLASDTVQIG